MPFHKGRSPGPAGWLAVAGLVFAGCAASPAPANPPGGGSGGGSGGGGNTMTGAGGAAAGSGGNTGGLKLATGGPYSFPQHRVSGTCTLTTAAGADSAARSAYTTWLATFVTASGAGAAGNLRVQRPSNQGDTVSEGIGYGMLGAVYMDDRPTFDGLWNYGRSHFNANGLMSWHLTSGGTPLDMGSASDGDVDMIWALIMASDQWSTDSYLTAARAMIQAMRDNSIGGDGALKPGDTWGGTPLNNPSYFSPAYFRVFAVVSGDLNWSRTILDKNYAILATVTGVNGLVPDWTTNQGVVNTGFLMNGMFDNSTYAYDAARTPWRIAMDWCFNGETRARDYLMKVGGFFNGVGAANIGDGYALNGSVKSSNRNMAFIGPAGVSGMAGFPTLVDGAFNYGASGQGDQSYFPSSLRMISMLMMSGNFLDFTRP
jgi:endo-1,4-beta-D-glucanase Y